MENATKGKLKLEENVKTFSILGMLSPNFDDF